MILYGHLYFTGIVKVRKTVDGEEIDIPLVKRGQIITADLPTRLEAGGHSSARAWYLYKNVKDFVKDPWKSVLCPRPNDREPTAFTEE